MVIAILLVDGRRLLQLRERFLPKLLKTAALLYLARTIAAAASGGRFAPAFCRGINLASQLQRDQPLRRRQGRECAPNIAVARIPLPVLRDCRCEVFDGVLVASLPAGNAAVGGMDVSQREIVVGLLKYDL